MKQPQVTASLQVPKVSTDEIVRLAAGVYNQKTDERHYINEARFSFYNHATLIEAIAAGRAVDLVSLPKQQDKCVLIIGSGPTLTPALPLLKDWQGDIICSTSQATTLIYHGREPEHIMALDPDSRPEELAADTWEGRKSILHLHPGVNPELVTWWRGPISLFRKLQPQTPFFAREQAMGYSSLGPKVDNRYQGDKGELLIKGQLPMLACVVPAQMAVAKHLGYKQLAFLGCDFSFPGDVTRFTGWLYHEGRWVEQLPPPMADYNVPPDPVVETQFDELKSTAMQIFYSHQIVTGWRIMELNTVNTSHAGLLRMFPYVPFEEVLQRGNKGVKAFTLPQIRLVSEEHLAKQNVYFVVLKKGIIPHESKDPLHELPKMIPQIKQSLVQQGRGDELDLEANMRRIQRLFKKVAGAP